MSVWWEDAVCASEAVVIDSLSGVRAALLPVRLPEGCCHLASQPALKRM